MAHYADPTAAKALGGINREFARLEKKAKRLRQLYEEGKLSEEALAQAHSQFRGIYKHVLDHVLRQERE